MDVMASHDRVWECWRQSFSIGLWLDFQKRSCWVSGYYAIMTQLWFTWDCYEIILNFITPFARVCHWFPKTNSMCDTMKCLNHVWNSQWSMHSWRWRDLELLHQIGWEVNIWPPEDHLSTCSLSPIRGSSCGDDLVSSWHQICSISTNFPGTLGNRIRSNSSVV